jgi:hypothetical protein
MATRKSTEDLLLLPIGRSLPPPQIGSRSRSSAINLDSLLVLGSDAKQADDTSYTSLVLMHGTAMWTKQRLA